MKNLKQACRAEAARKLRLRLKTSILLSAAAALPLAWPLAANAATDTYIGTIGYWYAPASWSLGHFPFSGDDAILQAGTNAAVIVTFDEFALATNLATLSINSTTAGAVSLFQFQS